MPDGFDNTWGIVRESSVSSAPFSFLRRLLLLILIYIYIYIYIYFLLFPTQVHPKITDE